jgi:hypothetical protein
MKVGALVGALVGDTGVRVGVNVGWLVGEKVGDDLKKTCLTFPEPESLNSADSPSLSQEI